MKREAQEVKAEIIRTHKQKLRYTHKQVEEPMRHPQAELMLKAREVEKARSYLETEVTPRTRRSCAKRSRGRGGAQVSEGGNTIRTSRSYATCTCKWRKIFKQVEASAQEVEVEVKPHAHVEVSLCIGPTLNPNIFLVLVPTLILS